MSDLKSVKNRIKIMCAKCWWKEGIYRPYYTYAEQVREYKLCQWCGSLTNDFRNVLDDRDMEETSLDE
jgi:hypothetical protein